MSPEQIPQDIVLRQEYQLLFGHLPVLKKIALCYWEFLDEIVTGAGDFRVQEEERFDLTVLAMSRVLLNDPTYSQAMAKAGVDPYDNAILESMKMIDIAPVIDQILGPI